MIHMNIDDIASEFQILGSSISKFNLRNDFAYFDEDVVSKKLTDASYTMEPVVHKDGRLFGIIELFIKLEAKDKTKHKLTIALTIEGCFTAPEEMDEEQFKGMLGINGCTVLYSIARSFIISTTAQALAGGEIILPMINTFKLVEQGEKNKQ